MVKKYGIFLRDEHKEKVLMETRGVCFGDVIRAIENGGLLHEIPHRNQEKYPNQRVLIVRIKGYAYHIPYYKKADDLYLITIYPSRKSQKIYS